MKRKVLKKISAVLISGLFIANITMIMAAPPGGSGIDSSCDSGGPGSNSCEIRVEGSIAGSGGSFYCSVSCGPEYYACCSASRLSCLCKKTGGGSAGGGS